MQIATNFNQLQKLEIWRCFWNLIETCWIFRKHPLNKYKVLVMEFDYRFHQVLEEIEAAAVANGSSAKELVAWAKINARTLRCRNAKTLFRQWEAKLRNACDVKLLDIGKPINEMGDFDSSLEDSRHNLSRMVRMQDLTVDHDERHGKMELRKTYGGEIPELDWLPFSLTKHNKSLPVPKMRLNYDTDEYSTIFDECFRLGYPMQGMGRVLRDMKHKVEKSDLT